MSGQSVNFRSLEFTSIIEAVSKKQNKNGYHQLRQINKFFKSKLDEKIFSANVDIRNLPSIQSSQFVDQIRILNVQIPSDLQNLDLLHLISPSFFPVIEKVNVFFSKGTSGQKIITISQNLIFRGVHFIYPQNQHYSNFLNISIVGYHDVEILNSNFQGIGLTLERTRNITIKNTNFENSPMRGLSCLDIFDKIIIKNAEFFNCNTSGKFSSTLKFESCNEIILNDIDVRNFNDAGFSFFNINQLSLENINIYNCSPGVEIFNSQNALMQNCNICGFENIGIYLQNSTVNYKKIYFQAQNDNFEDIEYLRKDQFSQFINIQ